MSADQFERNNSLLPELIKAHKGDRPDIYSQGPYLDTLLFAPSTTVYRLGPLLPDEYKSLLANKFFPEILVCAHSGRDGLTNGFDILGGQKMEESAMFSAQINALGLDKREIAELLPTLVRISEQHAPKLTYRYDDSGNMQLICKNARSEALFVYDGQQLNIHDQLGGAAITDWERGLGERDERLMPNKRPNNNLYPGESDPPIVDLRPQSMDGPMCFTIRYKPVSIFTETHEFKILIEVGVEAPAESLNDTIESMLHQLDRKKVGYNEVTGLFRPYIRLSATANF